jgi:hypothetical protein
MDGIPPSYRSHLPYRTYLQGLLIKGSSKKGLAQWSSSFGTSGEGKIEWSMIVVNLILLCRFI